MKKLNKELKSEYSATLVANVKVTKQQLIDRIRELQENTHLGTDLEVRYVVTRENSTVKSAYNKEKLQEILDRLEVDTHEADSMTGDEVIAKVMDVYNSNKAIIEAAKVEESKTFEIMEQKVEMIDDIHEIISIRFNPYITEEVDAAWKINNSYTARGYEHRSTVDHKDGYSHIMLLVKIVKKVDSYEVIQVLDNGKYYPVEAIVMKLTDHTITFKTKRGKLVTESLHKIKGGKS